MQFLNPIWLTALAALAVPVVIHLWNIRPGKTLKVGSIRWFEEASPASSKSLKLLDILLLLLRCLLLTLLAVLLAMPVWQKVLPTSKASGLILIPKASINTVQNKYKSELKRLKNNGFEDHFFDFGFKKIDTTKLNQKNAATSDTLNYWQLIKLLPQSVPAGTPIHIFSPNTLSHFSGDRPSTPFNITWHTFTPGNSVKTWLAGAWLNPAGGIRVVQGTSLPGGISYQYFNLTGDGANSPFNISLSNGQPVVSLKNDPAAKINADTVTMRLDIYAGKNPTDARYLEAALKAVGKFSQRKMQITVYRQAAAVPQSGDWLFWLSEEPLKKTSARHVFYYAPGKTEKIASWIDNNETGFATKPSIYQSVTSNQHAESALWTDGYGRTILGKAHSGQTKLYPFYSHLNPAYTDLVWDEQFPLWLLKLTAKPLAPPPADTRAIDPKQLQPVKITAEAKAEISPRQQLTITNYLWLALAVLFFAERWLAHRNKTQLANG